MKANKHILYKTTASKIGIGANEVKVPEFPRDGHFSKVNHSNDKCKTNFDI